MIRLSQETEVLAFRLAAAQRVSVDEAVRQALEAQVRTVGVLSVHQNRDRSPAAFAKRKAALQKAVADIAAMPILDQRSPNEIMDDINAL